MFCKYCGKQLRDDAKFCTGCGAKVENIEDHIQSAAENKDTGTTNALFPEDDKTELVGSVLNNESVHPQKKDPSFRFWEEEESSSEGKKKNKDKKTNLKKKRKQKDGSVAVMIIIASILLVAVVGLGLYLFTPLSDPVNSFLEARGLNLFSSMAKTDEKEIDELDLNDSELIEDEENTDEEINENIDNKEEEEEGSLDTSDKELREEGNEEISAVSDNLLDVPEPENENILNDSNISAADIGDTVIFGLYEQNNNSGDGREPLEWIVVEKQNTQAMLVSRYVLLMGPCTKDDTYVTWENCTLREWLNKDFLNEAFDKSERDHIPLVTVKSHNNDVYHTNGGNDTYDYVYILDDLEAARFFSTNDSRQAYPTEVAKNQGIYIDPDRGTSWWWLRGPGYTQNSVSDVHSDGEIGYINSAADNGGGIRPAMWVTF